MAEPKEKPAEPATPALPTVFVYRKGSGVPRVRCLRPTRRLGIDPNTGQPIQVPGIIWEFKQMALPYGSMRVLHCEEQSAVTRANEAVPLADYVKLIMEQPEYLDGRILTIEEWQNEMARNQAEADAKDKRDREYKAELLAKRGKRGAAP